MTEKEFVQCVRDVGPAGLTLERTQRIIDAVFTELGASVAAGETFVLKWVGQWRAGGVWHGFPHSTHQTFARRGFLFADRKKP